MDLPVVARPLVCLMLLHQRDELLCLPSFSLKVIIIRSRSTSVHLTWSAAILDGRCPSYVPYHKVDGGSSTQHVGRRNNGTTASKVIRGTRFIEGRRLGVEAHVAREDSWSEHEGVVEVVLARLDEEHLQVVIQVGQPHLMLVGWLG